MDARVRRKLDMADRVREFNRVHPPEDATIASVVARLDELIVRAHTLATQQRGGQISQQAGNARRRALRRSLHRGLLRLLSRVGEMAAKDRPDLADRFRLPSIRLPHRAFMTAAGAMVAEARANQEAFIRAGMPGYLIDEVGQVLEQYTEATDKASGGRRDHIGARADLKIVAAEIVAVVEVVDGLNRHRFQNDPEQLAAWESAAKVVTLHRTANGTGPSGETDRSLVLPVAVEPLCVAA